MDLPHWCNHPSNCTDDVASCRICSPSSRSLSSSTTSQRGQTDNSPKLPSSDDSFSPSFGDSLSPSEEPSSSFLSSEDEISSDGSCSSSDKSSSSGGSLSSHHKSSSSDDSSSSKKKQHSAFSSMKKRHSAMAKALAKEEIEKTAIDPEPHKESMQQRTIRLQEEQSMMLSTRTGKSVKFVQEMLATTQQIKASRHLSRVSGFEVIAKDDMVFMTRRLLRFQSMLAKSFEGFTRMKSVESLLRVDIGYHYTTPEALKTIQTDGLLSKKERIESNTGKQTGREMFGNGVYTSNDPTVFDHFGPVGLMVARLKGFSSPRLGMVDLSMFKPRKSSSIDTPREYNTIIGNKKIKEDLPIDLDIRRHDEVVLKSSAQVIPLVKFKRGADADKLRSVQCILQELLDDFFNDL